MALNKTVKWIGVNTRDPLPIRKEPKGEQIGSIPINAKVSVCDTKSGWSFVKYDDQYGYVSPNYIKTQNPVLSNSIKWIGKTQGSCYMRICPRKEAEKVCSVPKGLPVEVMDTLDGFYYIQYGEKKGFVAQDKVKYSGEPITASAFLKSVKAVQEKARTQGWIYADSQSKIPCADKKISCDRLAARALWDLGITDQPKGGIAFRDDIDSWYRKHGFKKSTSLSAAKAGSVIICMNPAGTSRHLFVIAKRSGDSFWRYDCGCNEWIRSKQPLAGLHMSRLLGVYNL